MKTNLLILCAAGQLALAASPVWAATAAPATGADIFERHFAAVGKRTTLQSIQTVVVKAEGDEKGQAFSMLLQLKTPGKILLTASNNAGTTARQGRDHRARCWREDPTGSRELSGQESGELMDFIGGFWYAGQIFWSQMLSNAPVKLTRDGDQEWIVVGPDDGPFPKVTFDKASGVLARIGKARFEDYRLVKGVKFPFVARDEGSVVMRVKEIQMNVALDDAIFEGPLGKTATGPVPRKEPASAYATLQSGPGKLEITRRPAPARFGRGRYPALPSHDAKSGRSSQVDVRGADLSGLDLRERLSDLWYADFDDQTRWPSALPIKFIPQRIMELGKDPGLGVRQLHARGITGKGIGVGIIDQALLTDHVEYADRLKLYEEIHSPKNAPAQMHGPAVASIAVGRTVGVAPEADLYYIAEMHGTSSREGEFDWDFAWLAQSIHRLLDVNETLSVQKKMRVISISVGWSDDQKGGPAATAAVARAKKQGVFVLTTCLDRTHHLSFHGLGREPLGDPNVAGSFGPGSWWASAYWGGYNRFGPTERLLVPMDNRATASPTGTKEYVYYSNSGWSWSVPWLAGFYALACQVKPDITPEQFWELAIKTGQTIQIKRGTEEIRFGSIANPAALIASLSVRQ